MKKLLIIAGLLAMASTSAAAAPIIDLNQGSDHLVMLRCRGRGIFIEAHRREQLLSHAEQLDVIEGVSACYCVSNDGTLLALAQDEMGGRTPYIVKAGSKELLAFKDAYKFAELNDLVSVTPSAIAADNSAIMAFGYDEAMMVYCFLIH